MPKKHLAVVSLLVLFTVVSVTVLGYLAKYERGVPDVARMLSEPDAWLATEKDTGTLARDLEAGSVSLVGEANNLYLVTLKEGTRYFVFKADAKLAALDAWLAQGGRYYALQRPVTPGTTWYARAAQDISSGFSFSAFLMLLLLTLLVLQLRVAVGSGGGARFKLVITPKERFSDVIGVREAKRELSDLVLALSDNEAFSRVKAKPPKGVLLTGVPGTGKTLLAKALAGESGASFIAVDGSAFTDKFMGNGVARVRALFEKARVHAPCVVFIDEIDGVGRRSRGEEAVDMENNRVINALLTELDGFTSSDRIVVLAASNHPENVDPALTREGRFDRKCTLSLPPLEDRARLFELYTRELPTGKVDFDQLARRTAGLSPASIAAAAQAAARLAARDKASSIEQAHFLSAINHQLMGAPSPETVMTEEERRRCAYHEAGHAIVGHLLGVGEIEKVTILPHSQALGVTLLHPEEDRHLYTKLELESRIEMFLGGRAAEIAALGAPSSGASSDLARSSQLAYQMVAEYGFSDTHGPLSLAGLPRHLHASAESAVAETRALMTRLQGQCQERLALHEDTLERMAQELLARETLEGKKLQALLARLAPVNESALPSQAASDSAIPAPGPGGAPARSASRARPRER